TIERSEFDFGVAGVESAEDGVAESRVGALRMRGRRKAGLVIDLALERRGAEIEGIPGREVDFDHAAVVFEAIDSVGKKFAVEEDVALGSLRVHVIAAQAEKLEAAADGGDFQAPGAAHALKGAADGFHGEVAGGVFEINASADSFHVH